LKLCVVIPALAEREGIGRVLDSLGPGSRRLDEAEVIVVVNHTGDAPDEVVEDNRGTVRDLACRSDPFRLHVVERVFPSDVAGVGAARRAGMDAALRRIDAAGAIACLDADAPVAPGYLDAVLDRFGGEDSPCLGICAYRHPVPDDEEAARAILAYELWLRYLEHAVRLAGSPYAFQTVGSTLVASPRGYALADGMPRRQAGEDFYFLQKVVKAAGAGGIGRVPGACVFPSPRVSRRVPFGTGRAMLRCREEGPGAYLEVEPPSAYRDLGAFFDAVPEGFDRPAILRERCHPSLAAFIDAQGGFGTLDRLRDNSPDAAGFVRAVHGWFDSLKVVRYAHAIKAERGGVFLFDAIRDVLGRGCPDSLPGVRANDLDVAGATIWLDWLRSLEENACARSEAEGMNSE
jgi:glycosyltransferase involved in cell wall biosynthesis